MFKNTDNIVYRYTPILAVRISEMTALEELPDKAKDIILPLIPLRGWVGSNKLEKSIERIGKAFPDRPWIADIDSSFVDEGSKKKDVAGEYPRAVFAEVKSLLASDNGYDNWVNYVTDNPNMIPVVQLQDINQLRLQLEKLNALGRGLVFRFSIDDINSNIPEIVFSNVNALGINDLYIFYDYGQVNREILTFSSAISSLINNTHDAVPEAMISISCSSFPSGFSGYNSSENSIYERILFNSVSGSCDGVRMLYSDRGSARADRINGGGGIPSPRIDYPLQNDWRFIREEFEDYTNPKKGEKEMLYTSIAKKIMSQEYWQNDLHVWGTQIIEFTSRGDKFGINSPMKATAVRINIHMHHQLYYNSPIELTDTDEDWED